MQNNTPSNLMPKMVKSEAELREILAVDQIYVVSKHATGRDFCRAVGSENTPGLDRCVCRGEPLFASADKFPSDTDWPTCTRPLNEAVVSEPENRSFFMHRSEVRCAHCDPNFSQVFPDGTQPTGTRDWINGVALNVETDIA